MSMQMMVSNWKNFFRLAVGKHKHYPVKVHRDHRAKQYDLIGISKDGDVGHDLSAVEDVIVPAPTEQQRNDYLHDKEFFPEDPEAGVQHLPRAIVPTGIRLEMQNNVWCSIEARSSASSKMLITPDAIIDSGYRGELFAVIYNFGYKDYQVTKGERIVQVIFQERVTADIIEVDKLGESERGTTGFGSTGD